MTYIDLHHNLLTNGLKNGLCNVLFNNHALGSDELFQLMTPEHREQGMCAYWAFNDQCQHETSWNSEWEKDQIPFQREYTPLRQNIVLFLAAMNNEL